MVLHFLVDAAGAVQSGDAVTLTGAEAHHAASVRRIRHGEQVTLGDGRGSWLEGVCEAVAPGEVVVRVSRREEVPQSRPRLVLAQALAKGDRDELAVQAATELGVAEILPWQAARSVSRWQGPKADKGRARWATIVREAAKQAHRAWVPEVAGVLSTRELAGRAGGARMLVLDPTASRQLSSVALDDPGEADIILVVGPEGGIADDELVALEASGAWRVRLGETVLRTSTAGPAALAVVNTALGRW